MQGNSIHVLVFNIRDICSVHRRKLGICTSFEYVGH